MNRFSRFSIYAILVAMFFLHVDVSAQKLSKEDALKLALAHNYDIQIAENNTSAAAINASRSNAGFLPTVNVGGGVDFSSTTSDLVFRTGEEARFENASTVAYNGALNVNYVLFDGLGRKYNYQALQEQFHLTELQARQVIEGTLVQVEQQYHLIAELAANANVQLRTLSVSRDRVKRAQYSMEYGQGTGLDVLNAEVDLNTDSIAYLNLVQQLANAKRDLNLFIGRDVAIDFEVDTTVAFELLPDVLVLEQEALANNVLIQQASASEMVSTLMGKRSRSAYLPSVSANGSYVWSFSDFGFNPNFQSIQNLGPAGGLTLSWNIFDGGATSNAVKNAQIGIETARVAKAQQEQTVRRELFNAYESHRTALFVLEVQRHNLRTNERNFARSEEQFRSGQITSIEYRQAQVNLANAASTSNTAKYAAKNAELQVRSIAGRLLQ